MRNGAGRRGPRGPGKVLAAVLVCAMALAGCGGGGGDAARLSELRDDARFTSDRSEVVRVIDGALRIARRNDGTPLGDRAYALAERSFLTALVWYPDFPEYTEGSPEPPYAATAHDSEVAGLRSLAGFVAAVPTPYRDRALETLRQKLVAKADSSLDRLEQARDSRRQWVDEMQATGSTSASWVGGLDWLEDPLVYLRDLAATVGEPPELLAAWDTLVAAVMVGQYAPSARTTTVDDGTIESTYTAAEVREAAQHVDELAAAIDTARAEFPAT